MNRLARDLRYGLRMLLKTPSATTTVLLALSLGIGLSGLTFSLIDGALLTTLPFERGDRIVRIDRAEEQPVTAEDYAAWSSRQRSFESLGAVEMDAVTLAIEGAGAEPVSGAAITPSILPLLSVSPAIGRPFTAEDAAPGAPAVVLVGHEVWRDRLNSDPGVLGSIVRVDGRPAQVVGVMAEGFGFPFDHQLWLPLELDPLRDNSAELASTAEWRWVVGRLRDGVTARAAAEELSAITRELDEERRGAAGPGSVVRVVNYTDLFNPSGVAAALAGLLLGVAFLVLLVACANVTNVLLARTAARSREVAVRLAIGASRIRIAAQLLAEISLLAAAGAAGGAVVAMVGMRFVESVVPQAGMPFWIEFRMNLAVLAFVALTAVLAAFMAGILPALQASRSNPHDLLKDNARGGSSFRLGRVMRRLIGVEMALSFVLLVLAGLFIKSGSNFRGTEFSFQPEGVYTARIRLPDTAYGGDAARVRFAEELRETLAGMPQITDVVLATAVPGVGGSPRNPIVVEGTGDPTEGGTRTRSIVVTPGYFEFFRTTLVAGRDFDERDRAGAVPVAIVNEAFARRHFPEGALEKRIRYTGVEPHEWLTIVGVIPDLMAGGVEGELQEAVYLPLAQNPLPAFRILARPTGGFASLPAPVRETVAALDPDVALFDILPLDQVIALANSQYTWFGLVFSISGGVALFLAGIGLYGVMAFWVVQRTREIGVRMAVGGRRSDIVRLVLRQGMTQTSIGLFAGVLLALPASRLLGAALFGVAPWDPAVYGAVLAVLLGAAWLGCWLPARRATRIDPLRALAAE